MKTRYTLWLMLAAGWCAIVPLGHAQGGPPPWAGRGHGQGAASAEPDDQMAALDRFLAMSDAELDEMHEAITRVRAMSPVQRAALREQIAAYRRLPADEREEIRTGWGWHNAQDRDDWRTMMRGKTPEDRAAIQTELQALPADQRMARKRALLDAWRQAQNKTPAVSGG